MCMPPPPPPPPAAQRKPFHQRSEHHWGKQRRAIINADSLTKVGPSTPGVYRVCEMTESTESQMAVCYTYKCEATAPSTNL